MTESVFFGLGSSSILTASELRILAMIASGYPLVRIARRADISEHTVKYHLKKIFLKLGARGRAHAVAIAISHELIPLAALAPEPLSAAPTLTPAQHRVLGLMASGCSITQMADRIGISKYTVKYHLKFAFAKLGARGRANAIAIAACHDLLPNNAVLLAPLSSRWIMNAATPTKMEDRLQMDHSTESTPGVTSGLDVTASTHMKDFYPTSLRTSRPV